MSETKSPEVIQKAHDMVSAICDGRRDWIMSIPARPDSDPDLVIGTALSVADNLYAALETLVEKLCLDDDEGLIEYAEPMIAARAALAKARGEAIK